MDPFIRENGKSDDARKKCTPLECKPKWSDEETVKEMFSHSYSDILGESWSFVECEERRRNKFDEMQDRARTVKAVGKWRASVQRSRNAAAVEAEGSGTCGTGTTDADETNEADETRTDEADDEEDNAK